MMEDEDESWANGPFFTIDGVEHCAHEVALADLLRDEVVFCNHRLFDPDTWCKPSGRTEGPTVVLFVIANDVFAWACADAECFTTEDIGPLWRAHKEGKWGVIKWLCRKRGMQPQKPIVTDMKADGAWTDEMEQLTVAPPS